MTSTLKLVMFDLDGTLIETAPEIADAVNDTLTHLGLPSVTLKQVNDWIGHGTHTLLISALADVKQTTTDDIRAWDGLSNASTVFNGFYQQRCGTRSNLYPHVRTVLDVLAPKGVRLAVVTNKEGRFTQTVLKAHAMDNVFDMVISGDTLPTKKPNPAAIQHCLDHFGIKPEEAIFIGDSSIDAATAHNAGVRVWLLPYGYNMGEPVSASNPDRVIPDFLPILSLLEPAS
ncbi:phosphoglycolate phosphatase [Comamonadaceae bacterium M7527]|nr:phosphoglycolate phosphatase [Comamonadaceae bacterium M7527]